MLLGHQSLNPNHSITDKNKRIEMGSLAPFLCKKYYKRLLFNSYKRRTGEIEEPLMSRENLPLAICMVRIILQ